MTSKIECKDELNWKDYLKAYYPLILGVLGFIGIGVLIITVEYTT